MCRAADVLHPHLSACPAAVSRNVSSAHADSRQVPSYLHCIWGWWGQRVQLIVDNDNGFEGVDFLEIESIHGGVDGL
jgi:hypothetical protein